MSQFCEWAKNLNDSLGEETLQKLQEIEEAHNLWLAGKKEEKDQQQEREAAHSMDAARSFRLNQDE